MSLGPFLHRLLGLNRSLVALVLYLVFGAVVCFWRLGVVGLVQMEGMVADGGRTMLESGDWIVPRVYGEIYTYKPALAYWLAALAQSIADPPPEWLLRFPFALSAFVMGLLVLLLLGRITSPRIAFFCSVASISAGLFIQDARIAQFDAPLAAGVGVAVAAACVNLAGNRARASIWLLGYLGLAVGFLAKGVPALMCFAPGLLAAALVTRRFRRFVDWRHVVAVLLFALVAGGYLVAAYRSVGAVAYEQPLLEAKVRGFSWNIRQQADVLSVHDTAGSNQNAGTAARPIGTVLRSGAKPLYIWAAFLPWSLLLPIAFAARVREDPGPTTTLLVRSAQAFLVAGVVTFMATPTHEMRYYLPLCVPVGILSGLVIAGQTSTIRRRAVLSASVVGATLAAAAMFVFGLSVGAPPAPVSHRVVLTIGGLGLLGWTWLSRGNSAKDRGAVLMLLAVAGCLATESLVAQPRRAGKRDLRSQAVALARFLPEQEPVWVLGPADQAGESASLFYYLDRPIRTFRTGVNLPPADSYCVLSSDRLAELPEPSGLVFSELTRVRDPWRTYLLGRCSGGPELIGTGR